MGLPNAFPYEVMGAPHSLYIATVNTARPALNVDDPTLSGWVLVGSNGNYSYAEDGVFVNTEQAMNAFRGYASASPLKMFRSTEDVMVGVTLADLTLEQMAYAANKLSSDVSVSALGGGGFTRTLTLSKGLGVKTLALLVRGPSPYMDDGYAQFWVPVAANITSVQLPLRRDNGVQYQLQFQALWSTVAEAANTGEGLGVYEAESPTS